MDALSTDISKATIDSAGILINTGSAVVVVTGSGGAMIASGAGAVNATGGGPVTVNAAGAGATSVLAAQGTAKYESSSRCAADDTFTFLGWTLTRSVSGQVPRPTSNSMSIFVGLAVDAAVRVSHKKKHRGGFGRKSLRSLVNACAKRIVSCTRGTTEPPPSA